MVAYTPTPTSTFIYAIHTPPHTQTTPNPPKHPKQEDRAALQAALAMSMAESADAAVPPTPVGPGLPLDFTGNYELFGVVTHKVRGRVGCLGGGVGGIWVSGRLTDQLKPNLNATSGAHGGRGPLHGVGPARGGLVAGVRRRGRERVQDGRGAAALGRGRLAHGLHVLLPV